ncbi:MAG: hypothetical protein MUC68_12290 [Burkholderiaceae bacterium]|nr:hypothetical protein [Burkholderiaceae bacterium]
MSVFVVHDRAAPWRRALQALLALAVINTLLSMRNWWPTPAVLPDLRLSPEAVALWLAVLAWVLWRGRIPRVGLVLLSLLATLAVLGRYFAATAPALFGRPVNLYWDGQQIPTFLWVSAREYPLWVSFAAVGLTVAVLSALYFSLRWALRTLAQIAAPYALRARWTWLPTAAATVGVVMHLAGTWPSFTWHWVTDPVTPTYARQAVLLATALSGQATRVLPPSPALDTAMRDPAQALSALRGRDLNLVFLESYGAMVYDDPQVAPPLARARAAFGQDLAASGRHVASAFVRAATFAGASELSHLSLLSGIDLSDPLRHDLLLTTDRPTLARLFSRAGYESFGVYPALSWDWAESRFYGFDRFVDARDLDYRGPPLGYWKVPDQYAFAKLHALHPPAGDAPPRLLFFPTITTHLPFGPVPPFQPDLERLLTADPFGADESRRLLTSYVDWLDMRPNYIGMFEYTYRWLGAWMRRPEARETVWLLVGDHQPAASVSGEAARWDVPVHVISRDPALIARFVAQGFVPGLEPAPAPIGGMHDLTTMLLNAVGPHTAATGAAAAGSSAASAPGVAVRQ